MRLWNVGRGPAVVRDVRLRMGKKNVLKPMPRHAIVDTHSPGIYDATWTSLDVPADQRDVKHTGTLHIIYAHPNREPVRDRVRGRAAQALALLQHD
jgi:hypothetical protein